MRARDGCGPSRNLHRDRGSTLVTLGPQTVIADEFAVVGAAKVIVFGSWAARYHGEAGPIPADIDVLVLVMTSIASMSMPQPNAPRPACRCRSTLCCARLIRGPTPPAMR